MFDQQLNMLSDLIDSGADTSESALDYLSHALDRYINPELPNHDYNEEFFYFLLSKNIKIYNSRIRGYIITCVVYGKYHIIEDIFKHVDDFDNIDPLDVIMFREIAEGFNGLKMKSYTDTINDYTQQFLTNSI